MIRRSDPSSSAALIVCNFSRNGQSIPVTAETQAWRLALWTGDTAYGGTSRSGPAKVLTAGANSEVSLSAFEAAIYLREGVLSPS